MADDALEHALGIFDCSVTVLNVVTPLDASMSESGVLEPDEARLEEVGDRADELIVHVGADPWPAIGPSKPAIPWR